MRRSPRAPRLARRSRDDTMRARGGRVRSVSWSSEKTSEGIGNGGEWDGPRARRVPEERRCARARRCIGEQGGERLAGVDRIELPSLARTREAHRVVALLRGKSVASADEATVDANTRGVPRHRGERG